MLGCLTAPRMEPLVRLFRMKEFRTENGTVLGPFDDPDLMCERWIYKTDVILAEKFIEVIPDFDMHDTVFNNTNKVRAWAVKHVPDSDNLTLDDLARVSIIIGYLKMFVAEHGVYNETVRHPTYSALLQRKARERDAYEREAWAYHMYDL